VGPSVGWAVLLVAGLVECGGNDLSRSTGGQGSSGAPAGGSETVAGGGLSASGGSLGVAGTASGACVAPSAVGYQPMWTPPSNPEAGACTEQQVSQEYSLCEPDSGAYDQTGCRAFNVDPANSTCLGCVFGALGAANAGAVLVMPGGQWLANRAGCIALVDGDSSATGCGANTQAADVCRYSACIAACTPSVSDTAFSTCERAAESGACIAYFSKAACAQLPRYASCDYSDFPAYYTAMADLFCVSGPTPSAGGGDAAGAGP
jgi:hypothetical protein